MIQSLYGSDSISVAIANSADRSRRKHMMSSAEMPSSARPSTIAWR